MHAAAIEVAASTNGQLMPPIMGAAAFIIAEFIGISYFDVVVAAFIPAVISYVALMYISHLEALKLGLKGLPPSDIPHLRKTFMSGLHYLIPIVVLLYLLMIERWTAGSAVFYSIILLMFVIVAQATYPRSLRRARRTGRSGAVRSGNRGRCRAGRAAAEGTRLSVGAVAAGAGHRLATASPAPRGRGGIGRRQCTRPSCCPST